MNDREWIAALADALDEAAAGQTVDAHLCAAARAHLARPDRVAAVVEAARHYRITARGGLDLDEKFQALDAAEREAGA